MTFRLLAALSAAAVLIAGCAETRAAPSSALVQVAPLDRAAVVHPDVADPVRRERLVADAVAPRIPAFRRPRAARPFAVFTNPNEYGHRSVFLVKQRRGRWLEVYLPIRPNGTTGWIRVGGVRLRENPFRIAIDLSRNRLTLQRGERQLMGVRVAAGTGGTPTPTGLFYTTMLERTGDPGGAYGPFIHVLSAYSEVLFSFGGGEGQVGIHGTNDPSAIGSDVSHGCIRMKNADISRLTRLAPVGTPVRIHD